MSTDSQFNRDMMFFAVFLVVALADSVLWRGFTRRHPAEAQRPGDVGQLATTCGGSCLLAAVGLGAMGAVVALWVAGW